jgi:hypothetical protein
MRSVVANAVIDAAPRYDRLTGCFGTLIAGPHCPLFIESNVVKFPKPR